MFLNSLKQLFRRPGKALIFFLLIAAATALLTFAAVSMTETNQRIDAAESQFTTVATVTQNRQPSDALLHADMLNFEGAEYVNPPETRPYYLARVMNARDDVSHFQISSKSVHIVEFTPLEDSNSKPKTELLKIRIVKAHYNDYEYKGYTLVGTGWTEKDLEPGDEIFLDQQWMQKPNTLSIGKSYMGNLSYERYESEQSGLDVYMPLGAPTTTQCDPATGEQIESDLLPGLHSYDDIHRCDEITGDFWEPGELGKVWMEWINQIELWDRHWLPVIPTNGVQLLPTFHAKNAYIDRGREITPEEFQQGAKVCMISNIVALSGVRVGDKLNLPMQMALYGYQPTAMDSFEFSMPFTTFKSLDIHGKPFDVFFEGEYEVVGIYRELYPSSGELYGEAVIVPSRSITASDENNIVYYAPMNSWSTSFQITNGKIAEFNTALHKAVPETSKLEIVYDDNGYEEVMQTLKNARLSSMLLLAVGALSALTVIVLLLYFFVIKERKRTAIERSMGLSKRQCRVSLVSGILVLAIPAVALGSWVSWAMGNVEFQEERPMAAKTGVDPEVGDMSMGEPKENIQTAYFSRDYSLWAESENSGADITLDDEALSLQKMLYFIIPGSLLLCVLLLSVLLVNSNLRIEPILLLGGQEE
ncbi:ABC transporter permease [Acutalibacter caecimuris]|uniref:ABC transporter permease n=1 Tax=Acutalibacter caecimuris TaxID=3093657 RepID=UPI002AC90118|nr:FtsX-like permease family protein [Acutalibacter sp. M00118]